MTNPSHTSDSRRDKRVAIIGAGPAGMTAAYVLAKMGLKPDIYEGSDAVGGMAKTIMLWDQRVDLGPHRFFSNERRINELWLEVLGQDYSMVRRMTRIYYQGKFFSYPLKPVEALTTLGLLESIHCATSYLYSSLTALTFRTAEEQSTFESWVTAKFGHRLFEIFFKAYSEKLWGIRCSELDADFAAQRIKKLSLLGAIANALIGRTKNTPKTLVDEFAYPNSGSGSLYERMATVVVEKGGTVNLNTKVDCVLIKNQIITGLKISGGDEVPYDHVVSTMPITQLLDGIEGVPQSVQDATRQLKFRNTILVYLEIDTPSLFPDNWLYIHSPELHCGRITNFRNWSRQINGDSAKTILCMEYWCNFESNEWQYSDENWIELAKTELRKTGLLSRAQILRGHVHKIPRCYPVYRVGYKEHLAVIVPYLQQIQNLTPIGRYGSFKYNNQDHSILMGILAAENIGLGTNHDLWAVNTDDEYQELATITATGLSHGTL